MIKRRSIKRVDIKKILGDPEKRKALLGGACNFIRQIGRYT